MKEPVLIVLTYPQHCRKFSRVGVDTNCQLTRAQSAKQHAIHGDLDQEEVVAIELRCFVICSSSRRKESSGDYTWGFRIHRTTYNEPDPDARFAEAMKILNEYIRHERFSYVKDERRDGDVIHAPLDGKANEQLWQRTRHEIIEDCELEGASQDPSKDFKLAHDWVRSCRAQIRDSPRHRFVLCLQ